MPKPTRPAPSANTPPRSANAQNKIPPAQAHKPPSTATERLPSGQQQGYIVLVNPKEGYGFIRPNSVNREPGRDIHFSLRQVEGRKRVRAGQSVSYYLTRTEKGISAIKVQPKSVFSIPYLKFLVIGVASALLLLGALTLVLDRPASLALWIGLWSISFSIVTYAIYAYDKAEAQGGGLRVPEPVLHVLGALGGTPGAFVAIRRLPHKIRDRQFQVIFWLIAAAQAGFLVWLFLLR